MIGGTRNARWTQTSSEVNTAIFAGSIAKFFDDQPKTTLLDTPDHFDYDSACTMILNLACVRVIFSGLEWVRLSPIEGVNRRSGVICGQH